MAVVHQLVAEQLPSDILRLINGITILSAQNDKEFVAMLTETVEHRVEWVLEKANAKKPTKRRA